PTGSRARSWSGRMSSSRWPCGSCKWPPAPTGAGGRHREGTRRGTVVNRDGKGREKAIAVRNGNDQHDGYTEGKVRGVLVAVRRAGESAADFHERLEELAALAEAADVDVVDAALQTLSRPDGRTYVGRGKVAELAALVTAHGARVCIVDDELTPSQTRNLVAQLVVAVNDRSLLIPDILARLARSTACSLS